MRNFLNKIKRFLSDVLLLGENGVPSIGFYFLTLIIIFIICFFAVKITDNQKYHELVFSAMIGLIASLAATYLYDYSRFDNEKTIKNKILKTISRKFRLTSRLMIIYISRVVNNNEDDPTCYQIIQDYCSDNYDDSNFKKNKDIRAIVFDFIDDAKLFIGLERGLLNAKHLEQLFQIQLSYRDYLSRYDDLKNIEMESEQNKSRYKEFLLSLRSFLWSNQKIFEKGGLLGDIGACSIKKLKDNYKINDD